jgi:hypothetical protein
MELMMAAMMLYVAIVNIAVARRPGWVRPWENYAIAGGAILNILYILLRIGKLVP